MRYFTEFGKPALQKTICGGIYAKVLYFLVRVQCRRKESSLSLSHLLMSFLYYSCVQHSLTMKIIQKSVELSQSDSEIQTATFMDHSVVESYVLCGVGMSPPSPSQHHPPVSARPPNYEEPHVTHPASPQSTLLHQNVQSKLRQLEQLQYNLTKQVSTVKHYCFCHILMSRFPHVENSLHFHFTDFFQLILLNTICFPVSFGASNNVIIESHLVLLSLIHI